MKKPLFIYHGGCYDGFTAAWIFNTMKGDADFHPAAYGEDPPDCKGREVWLVDFSFKRDVMIDKVILPSTRTIMMDHHKTAEADLKGILQEVRKKHSVQRDGDRVVFDMARCGSAILYDELEILAGKKAGFHLPRYNGARANWMVDYVEDRDLWKWKLPFSKEISAYLASIPMTFGDWDATYAMGLTEVAKAGSTVLRYQDTFNEKAVQQARIEEIAGYKVPVLNSPYMGSSERMNMMLDKFPDAKFAANYYRSLTGEWKFGLRSRQSEDFDVSEIATQFGGGGHKNASGFEVTTLPFKE